MESIDQFVGRLEGKMDLMINNQSKIQDCMGAMHKRIDKVEDDMSEVKTDQKIFKRDIKWTVAVGAGILAGLKWLFSSVIK